MTVRRPAQQPLQRLQLQSLLIDGALLLRKRQFILAFGSEDKGAIP
ncbi:hypothetical protein LMG26858_00503 [Achromobacter anxifer]|uniref:Uncharacterized protein n=1 Tax=Achromobacter anxifer TaxID=1287737 RepID=A0A6S7C0W7_9BURK|nr:hypothetical protein LMG26858_00503 [Achromobacter anxifer]